MKASSSTPARALASILAAGVAYAAGGDIGETQQATNWTAIIMFAVFVLFTLWITKWAAGRTKSAADFYTAGGGITGFQNGLAIAGDYMSAASFLGISAAVMTNGYDGLIYSIGFLVGWPVITFLMAERSCATWASSPSPTWPPTAFPADAHPHLRRQRHAGGGGVLPDRPDGGRRPADQAAVRPGLLDAVIIVGVLMMVYVLFGGMTATTWVQIIKACLLLAA